MRYATHRIPPGGHARDLTKVAPNIYRRRNGSWKVFIEHEGRRIKKTFPPDTPQEDVEWYVLKVKGGRGWQVLAELQRGLWEALKREDERHEEVRRAFLETLRRVNEHLDRMPMRDGGGRRHKPTHLLAAAKAKTAAASLKTIAAPPESEFVEQVQRELTPATSRQASRANTDTIGGRIEQYRLKCGWTYQQFAVEADATVATVFSNVKGHSQPRSLTLEKYAQAFSRKLGRTITSQELLGHE